MFPANEGLGATTLMFVHVETCLVPPAKIISIMPIYVTTVQTTEWLMAGKLCCLCQALDRRKTNIITSIKKGVEKVICDVALVPLLSISLIFFSSN